MCLNPIRIVQGSQVVYVNCGHCIECLKKSRADWSLRIKTDMEQSKAVGYFLTLTYDKEHLPTQYDLSDLPSELVNVVDVQRKDDLGKSHTVYKECYTHFSRQGFLVKSHLSDFIKRLRSNVNRYYDIQFKFFGCGEYGHADSYLADDGTIRQGTVRPHYHVMIWFTPNDKTLGYSRVLTKRQRAAKPIYKNKIPALNELSLHHLAKLCWDFGKVNLKPINNVSGAANYVSKYVQKQAQYKYEKKYIGPLASPMFRICSEKIGYQLVDQLDKAITAHSNYSDLVNLYDMQKHHCVTKELLIDTLRRVASTYPIGYLTKHNEFKFIPGYVFRCLKNRYNYQGYSNKHPLLDMLNGFRAQLGNYIATNRTTKEYENYLRINNREVDTMLRNNHKWDDSTEDDLQYDLYQG